MKKTHRQGNILGTISNTLGVDQIGKSLQGSTVDLITFAGLLDPESGVAENHQFTISEKTLGIQKNSLLIKTIDLEWARINITPYNSAKTVFFLLIEPSHEEEFLYIVIRGIKELSRWKNYLLCISLLDEKMYHYEHIKVLGEGSFGRVSQVKDSQNKNNNGYAEKKIDLEESIINIGENGFRQSVMQEISSLRTLDHKLFPTLHEVYQSEGSIILIMDYLQGLSLKDLQKRTKGRNSFTLPKRRDIMAQLLHGLVYLHRNSIVHRDIKPENLIFKEKENIQLKLIDFGISLCLKDHGAENKLETKCDEFSSAGTPGFCAPEIFNKKFSPVNGKSDIFSAGILLYWLISGKTPFGSQGISDILAKNKICRIIFSGLDLSAASEQEIELLKAMLQKDPHERVSGEEALNFEYFEGKQHTTEFREYEQQKGAISPIQINIRSHQTKKMRSPFFTKMNQM